MSEFKPYKTKWLKIDLIQNPKDFAVNKNYAPTRQKSMDKQVVKERIIPHFPARMGSTANSLSSDGSHDNDLPFQYIMKNFKEGKKEIKSLSSQTKTRRFTAEITSSIDKSSANSKQNTLIDLNSNSQLVI